jgi:hypothetical protein
VPTATKPAEAMAKASRPTSRTGRGPIFAYYLRHRAEVEAYLAEQEREGADIQFRIEANDPPEGLRARLLAVLNRESALPR